MTVMTRPKGQSLGNVKIFLGLCPRVALTLPQEFPDPKILVLSLGPKKIPAGGITSGPYGPEKYHVRHKALNP